MALISDVQAGVTSVGLDLGLLETAANLVLVDANNVVAPDSEAFQVGFEITRASDFTYAVSPFAPLGGTIEHTGILNLSIDVDSTNAELSIGNFSIGFDPNRISGTNSGFFVADTLEGNGLDILFDIGNPGSATVEKISLNLSDADLLVAPELANALTSLGLAANDLTGADVGDAGIDAASTFAPVSEVQSGVTSVGLDLDLLESAANLVLVDTETITSPISDAFQVGFEITDASDFSYAVSPFTPIDGTIEHTGTLNLSIDDNDADAELSIGNFSIGFDASRVSDANSGFFVADTLEDNGLEILFDIGNPGSASIGVRSLDLGDADLLVAPEFAAVLSSLGLAASDLTGADVGDASINADSLFPAGGYFNVTQFAQFQFLDEGITLQTPSVEINGIDLALLFDETFYLAENADIAEAVALGQYESGFEHFSQFGLSEGRDPSLLFDEDFYLSQNLDVAIDVAAGRVSSGLFHYLSFGAAEGRDPSSLFNENDYLLNNADVQAAVDVGTFNSGFEHFLEFGASEGRLPDFLLFQEQFYLNTNGDVAEAVAAGIYDSGFEHYVRFGQSEGRDPSALFDESAYLEANPDVAEAVEVNAQSSGFEHFIKFGRAEGRAAIAIA